MAEYTIHRLASDLHEIAGKAICPAFKQDLIALGDYFAKQTDCALNEVPEELLRHYDLNLSQVAEKRYDFKYLSEADYYEDMYIRDVELKSIDSEFEWALFGPKS